MFVYMIEVRVLGVGDHKRAADITQQKVIWSLKKFGR